MSPKSRFENTLLALFLQDEAEGRHEAAEHLMRALETLCPGPDAVCGSPLAGNGHDAEAERHQPPDAAEGFPRRGGVAGRRRRRTE